ncbi:hypothetical protein GE061_016805 [Apolygus lucorum]|uniref:Uncharacterized protein n=1 Tax=Apolygus lucorum TaxID=248454 RepID=A0A6A4JVE1_APOLU|nr:hypothetical protein GE061_016805 [Apolygus lucorum]
MDSERRASPAPHTEDKSCQSLGKPPMRRKKSRIVRAISSRLLDKIRKRLPKKRAEDKRNYRECDVERALYRWYSRRTDGDESSVANCTIGGLVKKATILAKRLGGSETDLKRLHQEWILKWSEKFGLREIPALLEPPPLQVKSQEISSVLEEYNDDQIYTGLAFEFDWTSLPDRSMMRKTPEERIWLLMAGNKSGRHRTRVLITGKEWRPESLKYVNMLSQPVVYAGGGVGRITPDLFSWWFHREFAPAALVLNESGAVLVMEKAEYLPSPSDCVAANGKVKLILYSEDESSNLKLDQTVLRSEMKTRYAMLLLNNLAMEQPRWLSIPHFLSNFNLKEAFPLLHKAWLNVRPDTFSRCWTSTPSRLPTEEDRLLLLELQWISHDIGFEVTDEDVKTWANSKCEVHSNLESIKTEPREDRDGTETVPTASEAVSHLQKALLWMESEPIEPSYLLVLRDIITIAKQAGKMGLASGHPGSGLPFFCHNGDPLSQPPPAHMGIPPYQLDPKGGLTRPPMYSFSASQYPYPMLSHEISQVAASWHTPSMYPISSGSAGFRSPYPSSLPIGGPNLSSDFYRFSPGGLMGPHGLSPHSHPAIVTPGPKQELQSNDHNHR